MGRGPWDHPRSRGEYRHAAKKFARDQGSSPLSRGIRAGSTYRPSKPRIIPALAGNTTCGPVFSGNSPGHPRSRGEYCGCGSSGPPWIGSSPLSRGILRGSAWVVNKPWIIPALAGNTSFTARHGAHVRDHPRSRGEYVLAAGDRARDLGSSPLSRGIRVGEHGRPGFARIIPALAGNTAVRHASVWNPSDHPRSRGEYRDYPAWMSDTLGSSPLSRGILSPSNNSGQTGRIIPALAGNTCSTCANPKEWWDHPRSRGEYQEVERTLTGYAGSSPLSRGIPAVLERPSGAPRDHPRSRGEYQEKRWGEG